MTDYPDIERDVPAWKDEPRYGPILNDIFLTGLAQFVRAECQRGEWLKNLIRVVVRDMDLEKSNAILNLPEAMDYSALPFKIGEDSPQPDLAERLAWEFAEIVNKNITRPMTKQKWYDFFYPLFCRDLPRAEVPLAERLAREAAIQVVNGLDIMPTDDSIRAILLPLFREAVNGKPAEGRGGEG